ncbi:MAG TPA: type IV toxin-antitoxin system AbiEi family antitoxin domain-containing protein [Longimicrobiales bacterium]|nr:type IV toxin-antitoxin system AbiEi family antitoxin domain-containing protein [Longimicrobiales bacterium]
MPDSIEDRITALALTRHGVVTRAQLLEAGLSPKMVDARARSGRLRRVHRGVFLLGHLRGRLEPPWAPEMAAALASGPGSTVSHASAGGIWEVAPRPPRAAPVDITMPPGRAPVRRGGIRAHRGTDRLPDDGATVHGIPVTSAARTLLDLAGVLHAAALERAIATAERRRLIDVRDLRRMAYRHGGRPGAPLLRAVLGRDGDDGRAGFTRSEAEARFVAMVREGGLPLPETNVVVRGYEVDALWRAEGLAVEVDGHAFHGSRRSIRNDHRRDADLLAAGIRVMRVTWDQIIDEPTPTAVRLGQALVLAGAGATAGGR